MDSKTHISVRNLSVSFDGLQDTQGCHHRHSRPEDHGHHRAVRLRQDDPPQIAQPAARPVWTASGSTAEILVDGENIYDPGVEVTRIRKKMGLLSQRPQALPMSIYDNVAYGPRLHGLKSRPELDALVEHYLRVAGLWDEVKDRLREPAVRLSVGQQQRMCLARGLAVGPEIILGDEPTSALDPQSSQNVERRLIELKSEYTVVVVTHILRQAKRIADYLAFLYLGELVEHGPAAEMFANPRDPRTRAYLTGEIS